MSEDKDFGKINKYIEAHKNRKPPFVAVDDKEWEDALLGYQYAILEAIDDETNVQQAWTLIYLCAIAFCRGIERAEVKAGTRTESLYPRY